MNRRPSFRRDLTLVAATTAALVVGAGIGIGVYAQVAPTKWPLYYSGTIDADGKPAQGDYSITVEIFDAAENGTRLCGVTAGTVPVSAGRFRVDLGDCADEMAQATNAYVAVSYVGADAIPRTIPGRAQVSAVPWALEAQHAASADTLGTLTPQAVQKLVTGACGAGNSIRAITADGNVTCEPDDDTKYTGASGVKISGTVISSDSDHHFSHRTVASGAAWYAQCAGTEGATFGIHSACARMAHDACIQAGYATGVYQGHSSDGGANFGVTCLR